MYELVGILLAIFGWVPVLFFLPSLRWYNIGVTLLWIALDIRLMCTNPSSHVFFPKLQIRHLKVCLAAQTSGLHFELKAKD